MSIHVELSQYVELRQPLNQFIISTQTDRDKPLVHWYFSKRNFSIIGYIEKDNKKIKQCEFGVEDHPKDDSYYCKLFYAVCEFAVAQGILQRVIAYKR